MITVIDKCERSDTNRPQINLNESEIDLNKCEHFNSQSKPVSNWDWSKFHRSQFEWPIRVIGLDGHALLHNAPWCMFSRHIGGDLHATIYFTIFILTNAQFCNTLQQITKQNFAMEKQSHEIGLTIVRQNRGL